eukprot:7302337-Lingulodinium_polyedra.AAC.1
MWTPPLAPLTETSRWSIACSCAARTPASLGTLTRSQARRVETTSACSPAPRRVTRAPARRSATSRSPAAREISTA